MTTAPVSRIILVDDHPTVREGLAARIAIEPDLEVCWEAASVPEALRLIEQETPDLAIVDISLESGSGIDLISRLQSRSPPVLALVLSMYSEDLYAERAIRAGAAGYLTKNSSSSTIMAAVRKILGGGIYLSPEYSERILTRALRGESADGSPVAALSDRELDVFREIGQGAETRDIADKLKLSVSTVETYRKRIREKLNLKSGTDLTRRATQWVLENG